MKNIPPPTPPERQRRQLRRDVTWCGQVLPAREDEGRFDARLDPWKAACREVRGTSEDANARLFLRW